MVIKTKEFKVLDVEDIEQAVSDVLWREIKVGEMEVTLSDYPADHDANFFIYIEEEDEYLFSNELWPELGTYPFGLEEEYIFNFDTGVFKTYKREEDFDD